MSRRGSTLGTVTEEELATNGAGGAGGAEHGCWAQVTAGPVAEALAASTAGDTAYGQTPGSSEACKAVGSGLCSGSRQDYAEVVHSASSKQVLCDRQPSETSPHSSERDGAGTLRKAPPAPAAAAAAPAAQLPLQSPFDRQNKPSGLCAQPPQQQQQVQPTGQHSSTDSSSCQHGVELAGPAQLLLRHSSSGKVVVNDPSSSSSSELSQRDDSETQLIRAGLCRSDDHAD